VVFHHADDEFVQMDIGLDAKSRDGAIFFFFFIVSPVRIPGQVRQGKGKREKATSFFTDAAMCTIHLLCLVVSEFSELISRLSSPNVARRFSSFGA
jgi:hypothetical protein